MSENETKNHNPFENHSNLLNSIKCQSIFRKSLLILIKHQIIKHHLYKRG